MKSERKMKQLKAAAWDAQNAEIEAEAACDTARIAYDIARVDYDIARKVVFDARRHLGRACEDAYAYETGEIK